MITGPTEEHVYLDDYNDWCAIVAHCRMTVAPDRWIEELREEAESRARNSRFV